MIRLLIILGGALVMSPIGANGFPTAHFISVPRRTLDATNVCATVREEGHKGFAKEKEATSAESAILIKGKLVGLLSRMKGVESEFNQVEDYVNKLEALYEPAQTLGFLNMAMSGEWQLLFSTNLASPGNPQKFRLRELVQKVECNNLKGTVTNQAVWDLADEIDGNFDCTGTFSVVCDYNINQGARMIMELKDHILRPSRGSKIPKDVPSLVGRLHRAMPKEMFDPQDHAMDTTYLDADLRVVRMTGPRLEGVRGIFVRTGTLEIV